MQIKTDIGFFSKINMKEMFEKSIDKKSKTNDVPVPRF